MQNISASSTFQTTKKSAANDAEFESLYRSTTLREHSLPIR
ncbi:MAG: hypothetical protein RMI34_12420 [Chloroherpetonaceae bacterium]|nr:hypothetical protein [Chloroherpetonaceae bacterium]MDW8020862.1 hypothetical protein [Chloroherpetonaceae bacterium]MDW8467036.1 hypothetical protein [Chloroherpetonaceae bacterium]